MTTSLPGAALDELVLKLVNDRIQDALATALRCRPREYSSLFRPPGMTRRAFVEACRSLAAKGEHGVRKVGDLWVAEFAVFERVASRGRRKSVDAAAPRPWTPEAALETVTRPRNG